MRLLLLPLLYVLPIIVPAQVLFDDFEAGGESLEWVADDCLIDPFFNNPYQDSSNPSDRVLRYEDQGGLYANTRVQLANNINIQEAHTFSVKIYVSSTTLVGNQPLQVSLKLQDGRLPEPWTTQTEVIKPIVTDQWQEVTFDFRIDNYINLDAGSPPPLMRQDLNRIVLQLNGENNNAQLVAYLDDFALEEVAPVDTVFNTLVWADEFDEDGPIDSDKWHHQTRLPNGDSWFNGEIQHYTDRIENSEVRDGILYLTARRETFTDQGVTKQFTSARLNSKFAFTYGRVDIRARLPRGVGTWPAIWMLGQNISETGAYWAEQGFGTTGWPDCGEIDIMEHWGSNQNFVQSAIHTRSSFANTVNKGGILLPTASDEFHNYGLIWTERELIFTVDGLEIYRYQPDTSDVTQWPFFEPQYLLLNIAIQGIIEPAFSEGVMEIDYVRIYQAEPVAVTEQGAAAQRSAFPNPVADLLTIEIDDHEGRRCHLEIYSVEGKRVYQTDLVVRDGVVVIDEIEHLSRGVYVLTYEIKGQRDSIQFLKQ